jgi:DNA-binding CsgD family transcriptional regulator
MIANSIDSGQMLKRQQFDQVTLDKRQHTVLQQRASGSTLKEIAKIEHLSRSSIDRIMVDLFDKFCVSSTAALIAEAARHRIL